MTIEIYQHESLQQGCLPVRRVLNITNTLGIQIIDALSSGWYVLLNIIVFYVRIWWLLMGLRLFCLQPIL
jgi:hypothetical protein